MLKRLAVVALLLLTSCSSQPLPKTSALNERPGYISRTIMGEDWPLTVEEGELICVNKAVSFRVDGRTYAINLPAKSQFSHHIEEIQRPGTEMYALIDRGLTLCN